jgi:RNA polymerase sigma-70 factor (ECF subfamily)
VTAFLRQQHTFREVYLAHFDFVWGALRRLGVREQDAQDWTQKVFLIAYLKLPAFENRSSLRTWLFRFCINAASDYRRSAPIRREVATEPAAIDSLSGATSDGHEDGEARRLAAVAEAILNKLPENQRLVFVLFELEEMSGAEIAALLGISVGTVRSRLRLAREHFTRETKRMSIQQHAWRKQAL